MSQTNDLRDKRTNEQPVRKALHTPHQSAAHARRSKQTVAATSLLIAVGFWLCTAEGNLAVAQNVAGTADASSTALEEIVVTAEHKTESAQRTPIAMSVYGSDDLKKNGVTNIQDLSAIAEDVSFTDMQGAPILTMRGISGLDPNENGDPAVSIDIDGFYLIRPYSLYATMYDLDRVEVLRGPQGTLNGRNSLGGAINIITAQPTMQEETYASLEYGNYDALSTQGMANIPVSDKLQVRMAFMTLSHTGYRNNAPNPDGDDADDKSGRVEVAFQPSTSFRGLITLQYTSEGGVGSITQNIPYIYTSSGALNTNLPPGINSRQFTVGTAQNQTLQERLGRFNLIYDTDAVEFTLLGGYDQTMFHKDVDNSSPYLTPSVYGFNENEFPDTYNGELRLSSRGGGPLQWQAGYFAFGQIEHLRTFAQAPLTNGGYDDFFGFVYDTRASSRAGYAQASYQLTDALKLTAGARYTHDFKSEAGWYGDLSSNVSFSGNLYTSVSSSKTTYHLALDYDLTSANLLYGKVDTGYKAGGFNLGATTYQPETVTTYEVGSKNRFLADTLQLNLAAFYDNYANEQVNSFVTLASGHPVALTENAGKSRIYGAEGDLIYKVPVLGTLNASLDYLHARYTYFLSSSDPSNPTVSGNVQLAGNTPPQAPTWSARLGLEHSWPVGDGTLTGRIQSKLQSSSNFSFYDYSDTRQPSYASSDAYLTYAPAQAHWKLTAFMKNLTNAVVYTLAQENQYIVAYSYQFLPPRTFGLRLEYSGGH